MSIDTSSPYNFLKTMRLSDYEHTDDFFLDFHEQLDFLVIEKHNRIKHLEQELEELKKTKGLDYLKEMVLERNLKLEQFLLEMTDILIEVEDTLEVVRTPDHPIVKYSELLREIKGKSK